MRRSKLLNYSTVVGLLVYFFAQLTYYTAGYEYLLRYFLATLGPDIVNALRIDQFISIPFLDSTGGDIVTIFFWISFVSGVLASFILCWHRGPMTVVSLISGLFLPRELRESSVVYNAQTGEPVALCRISLLVEQENGLGIVTEEFSDLDGRHSLQLPSHEAKYFLRAEAKGFTPYEDYVDYEMLSKRARLNIDIPLVPSGPLVWQYKLLYKLFLPINIYITVLSILAFALQLYSLLAWQNVFALLAVFVSLLAATWNIWTLTERTRIIFGRVLDAHTNQPIDKAQVKVFRDGRQQEVAFSDALGVVRFNLPPGEYMAQITKDAYELVDKRQTPFNKLIPVRIKPDGSLRDNLKLMPPANSTAKQESGLLNPFAD